jgi:autotransporter-associated beta strand protein
MNPETPLTPGEEVEIRLTALLMGELSPEEAAALRAQMAENPELEALHARLAKASDLLREATSLDATAEASAPARLSPEKRERLLRQFKKSPTPGAAVIVKPKRRWTWLGPLAWGVSFTIVIGFLLSQMIVRHEAVVLAPDFSAESDGEVVFATRKRSQIIDEAIVQKATEGSHRFAGSASTSAPDAPLLPAEPAPADAYAKELEGKPTTNSKSLAFQSSAGAKLPKSASALSDVAPQSFWNPYPLTADSDRSSAVASTESKRGAAPQLGDIPVDGRLAQSAATPAPAAPPSSQPLAWASQPGLTRSYTNNAGAPSSNFDKSDTGAFGGTGTLADATVNGSSIVNHSGAASAKELSEEAANIVEGQIRGPQVAQSPASELQTRIFSGDGTLGYAKQSPTGTRTIAGNDEAEARREFLTANSRAPEVAAKAAQPKTSEALFSTRGSGRLELSGGTGVIKATDEIETRSGLTKAGSGTLTLSEANTYAGGTTLNGGALAISSGKPASEPQLPFEGFVNYGSPITTGSGAGTNKGGRPVNASDFPFVEPGGTPVGVNPVTSGNHTGSLAINENAIDSLLFGTGGATNSPAQGMRSLAGVVTDSSDSFVAKDAKGKIATDPDRDGSSALDLDRGGEFAEEKPVPAAEGKKGEMEKKQLYATDDELRFGDGKSVKTWVDDESTKLNLNTAKAEPNFWARQKAQVAKEADAPFTPPPPPPAAIPQPEVATSTNAFSTFSLNVSDVAFKLAGASLEQGKLPEPASIRSEEFLNAFDYHDPEPLPGVPLAFATERARYPFAQNRDLLRFSIKTAAAGRQQGRPLNLVLLLDNSGSMERADRVRILHEALRVLAGQLQPQDKLSIVTFARTPRLWFDGVPGNQAAEVTQRVSQITPEGGTNLEAALNLGYETAHKHYQPTSINRVVLLTDGAANLGDVNPAALKQKVEAQRKQGIALDCFGVGWEGYNDDLLEQLSRNGDGRYGFLNSPEEASTEFAAQLAGALHVAASDVKVQVEFNPKRVTAYRQIGYAKHQLTKEQFRDNTVDAAEIGAAESGNALYVVEVNPHGEGDLATVRARFKVPGTSDYREHEWTVPYTSNAPALEQSSSAMRLAATASAFSEWLAGSPYAAEVTHDELLGVINGVPATFGNDPRPRKLEWMIRQAKALKGN